MGLKEDISEIKRDLEKLTSFMEENKVVEKIIKGKTDNITFRLSDNLKASMKDIVEEIIKERENNK